MVKASDAAVSPAKSKERSWWQRPPPRFAPADDLAQIHKERMQKKLRECVLRGLQGEDAWDFMGWAQDGPANAPARAAVIDAMIAAEMAAAMGAEGPPCWQQHNKGS
jgi:hypothetical protein